MILHIAANSSRHIMYPFIEFVNDNFNKNEHFFILCTAEKDKMVYKNAITKDIFSQQSFFIENIKKADKVILHGLWYDELCKILLDIDLFEKVYWNMWGGDFYFPKNNSELKNETIRKIRYYISIKEDFEILKKVYNTKGKHFESFMYPSNLFKNLRFKTKKKKKKYILLGNSADTTNNHLNIMNKLRYKRESIIYMPLSYSGTDKYINKVINRGRKKFKNNLKPLTKIMPFDEYINFLSHIDIAIFDHKIQQALGNTITLLGMGKKVFLKYNTPQWKFFKRIGVKILNNKTIDLKVENYLKNVIIIKKYFSKRNLKKQLEGIFKS